MVTTATPAKQFVTNDINVDDPTQRELCCLIVRIMPDGASLLQIIHSALDRGANPPSIAAMCSTIQPTLKKNDLRLIEAAAWHICKEV